MKRVAEDTTGGLEADQFSETVGVSVRGAPHYPVNGEPRPLVDVVAGDGEMSYRFSLDEDEVKDLVDALYDELAEAKEALERAEREGRA